MSDETNQESVDLAAQVESLKKQMEQMTQNNQQYQQQPNVQPQVAPQPTQPMQQLQYVPAIQGVDTYLAVGRTGMGLQLYLFDGKLNQWRLPQAQESEQLLSVFGIPPAAINTFKQFMR